MIKLFIEYIHLKHKDKYRTAKVYQKHKNIVCKQMTRVICWHFASIFSGCTCFMPRVKPGNNSWIGRVTCLNFFLAATLPKMTLIGRWNLSGHMAAQKGLKQVNSIFRFHQPAWPGPWNKCAQCRFKLSRGADVKTRNGKWNGIKMKRSLTN